MQKRRAHALALGLLMVLHATAARGDTRRATEGDAKQSDDDHDSLYRCTKARGKIAVQFRPTVTLEELIGWAMSFSCKNFVYKSELKRLQAGIEILAPETLTAREAWDLFQTSLRAMGFTLVEKDKVLQIVESASAAKHSLELRETAGNGERIERLVVGPQHISLPDAKQALDALTSKDGQVVALDSAGLLLVTDYASHTSKMSQLLRRIDQPSVHRALYAIHVRFADIERLRETLQSLLAIEEAAPKGKTSIPSGEKSPSLIVSDARTRTLLLRSSEDFYRRALAIVHKIDVQLEGDTSGQVHVYTLEHADAETLATTLGTLLQQQRAQGTSSGTSAAGASSDLPALGTTVRGDVQVTHDSETNSLLILASASDYRSLVDLVDKLDAPRRQIFLEATILEMDLDDAMTAGAAAHLGGMRNDGVWFGGLQQEGLRTAGKLEESLARPGLLAGILGGPLDTEGLLGFTIPSIGVLFHALAEKQVVEILSSPQLMTTNNTEAKLAVGQSVPYLAGFASGVTAGSGTAFQDIKREDVNLTLKVTPHVNSGGMVRLDIDLNIKELLPKQEGLHPSWTTREIQNTVVIKDQETIAIGGLVSSKDATTSNKVPLLGDIPLLGRLFRSTATEVSKKNLIILLTPYVLSSADEAAAMARRKLAERERFLNTYRRLQDTKFHPHVDYRKKRGVVDEIARAVRAAETEAELRAEIEGGGPELIDGPIASD